MASLKNFSGSRHENLRTQTNVVPNVRFDVLCLTCEAALNDSVLRRDYDDHTLDKHEKKMSLTIDSLRISAEKGCHLCSLFQGCIGDYISRQIEFKTARVNRTHSLLQFVKQKIATAIGANRPTVKDWRVRWGEVRVFIQITAHHISIYRVHQVANPTFFYTFNIYHIVCTLFIEIK